MAVPEPVLRREDFQDAEVRQFRPRSRPTPSPDPTGPTGRAGRSGLGARLGLGLGLRARPKPRHARDLRPIHEAVTTQLLVVTVAGLSAGAAAIHFAVTPSRFKELPAAGVFFLLLAVAQAAWAIAVPRHHSRQMLAWGAAGNLAVVFLWLWVRVYGLPFGPEPWVPEPVGVTDTICAAFELTLALAATALLGSFRLPLRRLTVPLTLLGATVGLGTWVALLHASTS